MFNLAIILPMLSLLLLFSSSAFAHQSNQENQVIIHMWDKALDPQSIIIAQGMTIVFENSGKNDHWPASNIHPTHDIYPELDPKKLIKPGESWQFTFDQAGEWRYHDHLYPTLSGTIVVKEDKTSPSTNKTKPAERMSLKDQLKRFFIDTKATLLLAYFRIFPDDLEKHYLPNRNLARIASQNNDKLLSYIIKTIGPEKAIQKLFDESDHGRRFNCHAASHVVGRLSYELLGVEGLEKNITLCNSGYLDGFTGAFVKDKGTENLTTNLTTLCDKAKTELGKLICYHGAGHGLMGYLDNDLPEVINTCKTFDSEFRQDECLAAMFMENIDSRLGESFSPHPTVWLSETDLQFPCNQIDQSPQVQRACYVMQPKWMNHVYHGDKDNVVQACLSAKREFISSCFFGYGQHVAAITAKDKPREVLSLCEKVPKRENYFDQCLIGAQGIIMDGSPNMAKQVENFCNTLPEQNKKKCLGILDERQKFYN